jgi:hypothetical protein
MPGDMIISGGASNHVAIVDTIGAGSVGAVEQNGNWSGRATYGFSNGSLSRGTMTISGVVHDPDNGGVVAADAFDAGPSVALSDNATLMVQHTARNGDAKTNIKYNGGSDYYAVATGTTSAWSTSGTSDIANDPIAFETGWVAAVKDDGAYGKLYLFRVTPQGSTNVARLDVGSEIDQWSLNAPPSVVVDSQGNVYVAAVQQDGDMSIFKRNSLTGNIGRVSIGSAGAWSTHGTVNLALGPDDAIWYIAVTKEPVKEVRTYRGDPHTLTFNYYGKLGVLDNWTTKAAPAIVVDDDGDVTAVAVKNDGTMWGYHNVDGVYDNWVKINDDVGAIDTWSTEGSIGLAVSKAEGISNDRVYVAGVRNADALGGEMPIFMMNPDADVASTTWSFDEMLDNITTWSQYAAPDLVVAPGGTVFLVAVSRAGYLHSYSRSPSTGDWSSYGLIGSNGWAGNQP